MLLHCSVRRFVVCCGALLGLAFGSATTARALDQPLVFLRTLQAHGYGKTAIDYVNMLAERTDLPEDVRSILDLEMAASLRVAAAET